MPLINCILSIFNTIFFSIKDVVEANAKTFKLEKQLVMVIEEVAVGLCVFKNE